MAADVRRGSWAEPETELISRFVSPGDWAVDIGAHFGMWTYRLDRAVGPSGRVLAFEPVPFTYATLRKVARILRFRHTDLRAQGCGAENGNRTFTVQLQPNGAISAGQSHFASRDDARPGRGQHVHYDSEESVSASVVRLDDVVSEHAPVSLLKADIEGAELFALQGAQNVLQRQRPTIVLEINPWFLEGFGLSIEILIGFLEDIGYEMHRYETGTRTLVRCEFDQVVEDNYVFVHPSRR